MTKIDFVEYNGWKNCLRLENDWVRLVITLDVGPRIIHCNVGDGGNLFYQNAEQQGLTGSDQWRTYGGHRLWHGPQVKFRPNQPDNSPVHWEMNGSTVVLTSEPEKLTRVQKKMEVTLVENEPRVTLRHAIYNLGEWSIRLAPWALTALRKNGLEILPIPREDTFYLPNYAICCWPWTKLNDPRLTIGSKYLFLRHDPANSDWFKIGYRNTEGWGAYYLDGSLFVKLYSPLPEVEYPDYGSTFETYADEFFIELETIAPLQLIDQGECAVHQEEWYLFHGLSLPESEIDFEKQIESRIIAVQKRGKGEAV